METGDVVELGVTGVAHGGVFVSRHGQSGLVVFTPDTLPGERIRARVTDVRRSFARAETLEVLDASADRIPHVWREADVAREPAVRPGGADFGHIALTAQRELKRQVIAEAFERFAGGAVPTVVEPAGTDETADGTRWRTRLGLHIDDEGRVGPYAARSHDVIEVVDHPLATDEVARVALELGRERPGRIDLVQPADGAVRLLRRPAARSRRRQRSEVVTEVVAGRSFRVDAGGFWQVHRNAASVLDTAVREALAELPVDADAHHLDLYGGVGLFSAALADHGASARVTTVESAPAATHHARENLADLRATAITARVERFVADLDPTGDLARGIVLLDPPRAGAGERVVRGIAELGPRAIVYVACDPVALARDVGTFRRLGYDVDALRAFDLFPNSHHVEAIAVLSIS